MRSRSARLRLIAKYNYLSNIETNQRPFQVRWDLAFQVDLEVIQNFCPSGYQPFHKSLIALAKLVMNSR